MRTLTVLAAFLGLGIMLTGGLVGCTPEGGCRSTITGSDNTVTQACGGSGESSPATVTTPAPVVVPPVVITPVITPPAE